MSESYTIAFLDFHLSYLKTRTTMYKINQEDLVLEYRKACLIYAMEKAI